MALLLIVLPSALALAAPVQASMTPGEARRASRQAEQAARRASKLSEREARHAANQAMQQAKREALAQERLERWEDKHPNANLTVNCEQVTISYRGFPDTPGNTVAQQLTVDHDHSTRVHSQFAFDGPTGTAIIPLDGHAGRYQIDIWAEFVINGTKLHFDWYKKVICPPAPAMTIEKLQRIAGGSPTYTTSPLTGEVGQTVEYEMIVKNTGNTPLTLSALNDPHCDPGTIAGGPGAIPLALGASTTFTCTHLLNTGDQGAGSYTNTASDTGTPVGEGSPVTSESNTVVVEVPGGQVLPQPPVEKTPETPTTKTNSQSPSSGVLASSTATPASGGLNGASPKSGVLASKAAIPALNGPHGCVRAAFKASVKSGGVKSVGFYMDKRKLKSMTAHSARHGRISITIDPSKLSVGAHRLLAKITMVPTSAGAKARRATRSMNVVRCSSAVVTPHFTG
ncbi:MAG TPA: hypothetical protein VHT25_06495 [Solirubrobacteraceae bacterium]|nr:hypothetical protein [Solirubrobacteraceae bacterium]